MYADFTQSLQAPSLHQQQKKTEHHIQILPTQDKNGEYTIPPEDKQRILDSSTANGNFAKSLVFAIFSHEERKGRNYTGKSSSNADVEPLDPGKLEAVKKVCSNCTKSLQTLKKEFGGKNV